MHPVFAPIHFVRRQLWHTDPEVVCVYQIEDPFSYHKDRQDEKHIENLPHQGQIQSWKKHFRCGSCQGILK